MHSDHNQLVRVLFFEVLEFRQNVHAVDTAVRPEIEQHHFSPQIFHTERLQKCSAMRFHRPVCRSGTRLAAGEGSCWHFGGRLVWGILSNTRRRNLNPSTTQARSDQLTALAACDSHHSQNTLHLDQVPEAGGIGARGLDRAAMKQRLRLDMLFVQGHPPITEFKD